MNNNDIASTIRSKVDIVDIIGERIPLIAKGKNFFCVCPFHDDSNPSMCVSREKQIYTCFSCHATGNVYTFLMNYEHIDFKEALKYLGDKVGINTSSIHIAKKDTKFDNFYKAYDFSKKYFQNNLMTMVGKSARDYLQKRGFNEEVIKEFEIGLSLSSKDDLTELLTKKEYQLSTLNKIGLSIDDRDIYSDRIMFPLYDINGKTVGFSGRIYKDNSQNKYLNTKETPIFKKGEMLYHYHIAKEECRREKCVLVMEGFMDVIRASTIGIRNTVAIMGTALTDEQIKLLKRLSSNIILCLDGDDPGRKATIAIGEHLLEKGVEVKVIVLPNPDDPDTFILREGKTRFLGLVENAINFGDYKINALKENINFTSDEEKANYIHKVLEETSKIEDEIRVEIILKKLAKEFNIGYNTLEKRFKGLRPEKTITKIITAPKQTLKTDKYEKAVEQVIYYMLLHDWVITQVEKERIVFPSEESRIMVNEIIYYYKKYGNINIADFYTYLQEKKVLLDLLNKILAKNYRDNITKEILFDYFKVIREYGKNQEIKRLQAKMEKEIDPIEKAKIGIEITKLRIGAN